MTVLLVCGPGSAYASDESDPVPWPPQYPQDPLADEPVLVEAHKQPDGGFSFWEAFLMRLQLVLADRDAR